MNIHLVRHGETEANGQSYAGRSDVALTETGRAQARNLARVLLDRPIRTVLTSPLCRARETAAQIAVAHGLAPIVDPDLAEFDFGEYEGMSKQAVRVRLRKDHLFEPVQQGESLFDLWSRVGRVAERVRSASDPSGDIAVVGHFWSNRLLFGHLTSLGFELACQSRAYRPDCGSAITLALARRKKP